MSNERNPNNVWRNVVAGVGVAAAGALFAYLVNDVFNSEEPNREERQLNEAQVRRNSTASRSCQSHGSPRTIRRSLDSDNSNSQLRMNIKDKLNSGTYDCSICLEDITKHSNIVSCKTCFIMYHLDCLKKHFTILTARDMPTNCPTCRAWMHPRLEYRCFCGKQLNPPPVEGRTPHCCGGACRCRLPCHPGPCESY